MDQITKEPSSVSFKIKNPNRVAAGKKLAERNKRVREEHARYESLEAERVPTMKDVETGRWDVKDVETGRWLTGLSLTNVISLVGIGLTAYTILRPSSRTAPKDPELVIKCDPDPEARFGM